MTLIEQLLTFAEVEGDEDSLCKKAADTIEEQQREIERLLVGHDRYETVRLMNTKQFEGAYMLNRVTGKPFDEIIDDLKPFVRGEKQPTLGTRLPNLGM